MGRREGLVMDGPSFVNFEGNLMAEEEPLLNSPPTQDMVHHVGDYSNFTKLLKWGAIICFIVGLLWVSIVKAYW